METNILNPILPNIIRAHILSSPNTCIGHRSFIRKSNVSEHKDDILK